MVGPEQLHRPMGAIAGAPDSKLWAASSSERPAADKAHCHDASQAHVDFMGSLTQLLQAVQAATTPTAFDLQGRTLELTGAPDEQASPSHSSLGKASASLEPRHISAAVRSSSTGADASRETNHISLGAATASNASAQTNSLQQDTCASQSWPSNALATSTTGSDGQPATCMSLAGISAASNSVNAGPAPGTAPASPNQAAQQLLESGCRQSVPVHMYAPTVFGEDAPLQTAHSCPAALCGSPNKLQREASTTLRVESSVWQNSGAMASSAASAEVPAPETESGAFGEGWGMRHSVHASQSLPELHVPKWVSEASIAPRVLRKTPSAAESFRQSCSQHPRSLAECLQADSGSSAVQHSTLCTGTAVRITNGTLRLPAGHVLNVEGGSITLQSVTVESVEAPRDEAARSVPLLLAARTELLELDSVTVSGNKQGHGLGIGSGAAVRAQRCTFSDNWTCGAVLRGAGARLDATACEFSNNGQDGVSASGGAAAALEDCKLARNTMLGVGAAGAGTCVTATRCAATGCDDHGFAASNGAALELQTCRAEGNNIGVLALGAATVARAQDCVVSENKQGAHVREGAELHLAESSLSRNRVGVCACDAGTRLVATGTSVIKSTAAGVQVFAGSSCSFERGAVSRNAGHGVAVKHKHSCFDAEGVAIEGNGMAGVNASVMASVRLMSCQLLSNTVSGLQATDCHTTVEVEGCSLSKNQTIGAFVNKGSRLLLTGCQLNGNGSSGCEVRDRASSLAATSTQLSSNGRVGLYTHSAANAELEACTVEGNEAFGALCGGRAGTDIGGGTITLAQGTEMRDGKMVRHGGRIFADSAAPMTSYTSR